MKLATNPIVLILISFLLNSCAYRFTNLRLKPPSSIKKIAVEGIFDISREVISHEILWSEIQREIAKSGKLIVSSQANADALLRIKIEKASIVSFSADKQELQTDTDFPKLDSQLPQTLPELNQSGIVNIAKGSKKGKKESFSILCEIEVWNLKNRKLIFKRAYGDSNEIGNISNDKNESEYLKYEEQIEYSLKAMSKNLSRRIVSDLFLSSGY